VGFTLLFRYSSIVGLFILPVVLAWALWNTYDWSNDTFVITTKRVVRIDRRYIFSEDVIEAPLMQIQNVSVTIPDMVAQLLNYGTLVIETAATGGRIVFDSIGNPYRWQREIARLRGLPEDKHETGAPHIPRSLTELVGLLLPCKVQRRGNVLIWHKHCIVLLYALSWPLLAIIVLSALFVFARWPGLLMLIALDLPVLLWQYVNWWNDIYILTEDQIIDIERVPFIYENRREAFLAQIQNVQYTIPDLNHRLLNYGTVLVETAGKAENFTFVDVPNPAAVQGEIVQRMARFREQQKRSDAEAMASAAQDKIRSIVLDILHTQGTAGPPSSPSGEP